MYKKFKTIHLIGIGGIGMSGIAELLHRNGHRVTGSDLNRSESVRHLEDLGIRVAVGHRPENILGAELVVHSSAVKSENPEYRAAIERGLPAIPRAEMLAELMRLKYGIAVAGAHGKTTTTSMIASVLVHADVDPTVVVGGRMDSFGGTNARLGGGEFMVVEADESDGSFNRLSPSIAVVTNMDREHLDHYKDMHTLREAFLTFINSVPFYGLAVFCGDDPYLRMLSSRITRSKVTYGFSEGATYQIEGYAADAAGTQTIVRRGRDLFRLKLALPGKHNALNAVAAIAVADELGIAREKSLAGIASYRGVQRRFQYRGEKDGVHFIDDYAHHPSEIRATLSAARERFPKSNVRVVFQPHRFSRVEDLFDDFTRCFSDCDGVAITDIYAAGEKPIPGVSGQTLVDGVLQSGHANATHLASPRAAIDHWCGMSAPGDVVITLGAGDLPMVYRELF